MPPSSMVMDPGRGQKDLRQNNCRPQGPLYPWQTKIGREWGGGVQSEETKRFSRYIGGPFRAAPYADPLGQPNPFPPGRLVVDTELRLSKRPASKQGGGTRACGRSSPSLEKGEGRTGRKRRDQMQYTHPSPMQMSASRPTSLRRPSSMLRLSVALWGACRARAYQGSERAELRKRDTYAHRRCCLLSRLSRAAAGRRERRKGDALGAARPHEE